MTLRTLAAAVTTLAALTAAYAAVSAPPAGSGTVLISDFSHGTAAVSSGAGWSSSTDRGTGGRSSAHAAIVHGGVGGSKYALEVSGTTSSTGSNVPWAGVVYRPGPTAATSANLTGKRTLRIWVRGSGGAIMYARILNGPPSPLDRAFQAFTPTPQWTEVDIPLADFPGADLARVTGIGFYQFAREGSFRFEIGRLALDSEALPARNVDKHPREVAYDPTVSGFNPQKVDEALGRLAAMLAKNPKNAEALVWHGDDLIFKSWEASTKHDYAQATALRLRGEQEMDQAVALEPYNEGTVGPRASAMLGVFPWESDPAARKADLRKAISDLEFLYREQEPLIRQLDPHDRAELLFCLAEAYEANGDATRSQAKLRQIQDLCASTPYADEASQWLSTAPPSGTFRHHTCFGCHGAPAAPASTAG